MIKGKLLELYSKAFVLGKKIPIKHRLRQSTDIRPFTDVRNNYCPFHTGKFLDDASDPSNGVMTLAIIEIPIRCEQHLGRDLTEPVQIPLIPKSGEQEDQIAPILVVANIAIMASGILGR